jgi:hypothetical protein
MYFDKQKTVITRDGYLLSKHYVVFVHRRLVVIEQSRQTSISLAATAAAIPGSISATLHCSLDRSRRPISAVSTSSRFRSGNVALVEERVETFLTGVFVVVFFFHLATYTTRTPGFLHYHLWFGHLSIEHVDWLSVAKVRSRVRDARRRRSRCRDVARFGRSGV